jgi:hypothetical protein
MAQTDRGLAPSEWSVGQSEALTVCRHGWLDFFNNKLSYCLCQKTKQKVKIYA